MMLQFHKAMSSLSSRRSLEAEVVVAAKRSDARRRSKERNSEVRSVPGMRIGADENGLGARLGPMIVTAVLADVDEGGARLLGRKLPQALRRDLADSKTLVSCHDTSLGEAWSRALVHYLDGEHPASPQELFRRLSREPEAALKSRCPSHVEAQCWSAEQEQFEATEEQLERVRGHLHFLEARGVRLRGALTQSLCSARLNELKRQGIHRFTADLHAMESLVLDLRAKAGRDVIATCGKVGGIGRYEAFFGPLSGRLRTVLGEARSHSVYSFPGIGELRFVRDADSSDPLVMLASLVGKYVRELLMRRVARYYPEAIGDHFPSGYHDPVTTRFYEATRSARTRLRVTDDCFVRAKDPIPPNSTSD